MRIEDLAALAGVANLAELSAELRATEPVGYSIDSRTVQPGELFFAIKGEVFDGHDFVLTAFEKGAVGVVLHRPVDGLTNEQSARCLYVEETLAAMQNVAHDLLAKWGRPIVGITGSMGKTTGKDLTALVLSGLGRIYASVGNLNNGYGLPLAVLKMVSHGERMENFDYAVLEMGMSTKGEIARLCEIAPPHVVAVLNVAPVHIENFADGIDGVRNAKAEIVHGLRPGGLAVLNVDDPLVAGMAEIVLAGRGEHAGSQVVYFGRNEAAHVAALDVVNHGLFGTEFTLATLRGEARVTLPLAGEHYIYNALAAAAIGLHFGVTPATIAEKLGQAKPAKHRGEILRFKDGFTVVDDAYNSNPKALNEVVRLLSQVPDAGRRIVLAGEMLELGEHSVQLHAGSGAAVAACGIDLLGGVRGAAAELLRGAREAGMAESATVFLEDSDAAGHWLVENIRPGDVVVVKGSRGVRMEKAVEAALARFELQD